LEQNEKIIKINLETVQFFEAMLCELIETYLALFAINRLNKNSRFNLQKIKKTSEAATARPEEGPVKE
jgi:hypothetical protein